MRTTLKVKNYQFAPEISFQLGIVSGYLNNSHTHEYQVFDLKKSIENIGLIGVDDKQNFAIRFKTEFSGKFATAVYLDGVNISQQGGINSLNEIREEDRSNYFAHKGKFISENQAPSTYYLYRYSQKNNENRLFSFTSKPNAGINEILLGDSSLKNRIEVYLWVDEEILDIDCLFSPDVMDENESNDIKIGAGNATNEKYSTIQGLEKPFFIGKSVFTYINSTYLNDKGESLIPVKEIENFSFEDPMDQVPYS